MLFDNCRLPIIRNTFDRPGMLLCISGQTYVFLLLFTHISELHVRFFVANFFNILVYLKM